MNIKDALRPTGKANYDDEKAYAMRDGDDLYWYKEAGDARGQICNVSFNDHFRDDWFPYYDKPVIRPEKAGELWKHEKKGNVFIPTEKLIMTQTA